MGEQAIRERVRWLKTKKILITRKCHERKRVKRQKENERNMERNKARTKESSRRYYVYHITLLKVMVNLTVWMEGIAYTRVRNHFN
jgi:hypothetical protein